LIEASSSSSPLPRGSSPSQRKTENNNNRGLAKANKEIKIYHKDGALKALFQGDSFENLLVSHDGEFLRLMA